MVGYYRNSFDYWAVTEDVAENSAIKTATAEGESFLCIFNFEYYYLVTTEPI